MLTAKEVAERLNCSLFFVYKHFKELGGFKIGRLTRFRKEQFEEILKELEDGYVETSEKVSL
jgi:excisionase family DNA binding protein